MESPVTAERDSVGTDGDAGLQKTRQTQRLVCERSLEVAVTSVTYAGVVSSS